MQRDKKHCKGLQDFQGKYTIFSGTKTRKRCIKENNFLLEVQEMKDRPSKISPLNFADSISKLYNGKN